MNSGEYTPNSSRDNEVRVRTHDTQQEAGYWADFYAHNEFSKGSSFFEFINEQADIPATVIDIGCGDGRDSFAFARSGKTVLGLDRSEVGVEHASKRSAEAGLNDNLAFSVCDVSDEVQLSDILSSAREATGNASICFYMRFFLHSIPEEVQGNLLTTIASHAEPGDVFAAEFRTDKDEDQDKAFGNTHYRRYQNADEFSKRLCEEYGWNPVFEFESKGLSPYKEEDPFLYRVVSTRNQ